MKRVLALFAAGLSFAVFSAERAVEIDPNTKIQGGADVRGSGANAGAGAQTDNQIETDKPRDEVRTEPRIEEQRGSVAGPDKSGPEKDKPLSERKPQEREREDAAKGDTAAPK